MEVGVWTKPCESAHCVQAKKLENGSVLLGSTVEPGDLLFTAPEWAQFVEAVKAGRFDL